MQVITAILVLPSFLGFNFWQSFLPLETVLIEMFSSLKAPQYDNSLSSFCFLWILLLFITMFDTSLQSVDCTLLLWTYDILLMCHVFRGHDFSKSFGPRTVIICDQVLLLWTIARHALVSFCFNLCHYSIQVLVFCCSVKRNIMLAVWRSITCRT